MFLELCLKKSLFCSPSEIDGKFRNVPRNATQVLVCSFVWFGLFVSLSWVSGFGFVPLSCFLGFGFVVCFFLWVLFGLGFFGQTHTETGWVTHTSSPVRAETWTRVFTMGDAGFNHRTIFSAEVQSRRSGAHPCWNRRHWQTFILQFFGHCHGYEAESTRPRPSEQAARFSVCLFCYCATYRGHI